MSSLPLTRLVETELLRERLYGEVYSFLRKKTPSSVKSSVISHLLLRYVFNHRRKETDDPVFITTPSTSADRQFRDDCVYLNLGDSKHANFLLTSLSSMFAKASYQIKHAMIKEDQTVSIADGHLVYGRRRFRDYRSLGVTDRNAGFAVYLRYRYLDLSNHGLTREYQGDQSSVTEGFASVLNHYYDHYCSFFPDLEARFGALPSFFDCQSYPTIEVQVNPPFDETVIADALQHIYDLLVGGSPHRFVVTLPNWNHFPALAHAQTSVWCREVKSFDHLQFVETSTGKKVTPCAIVELVLSG